MFSRRHFLQKIGAVALLGAMPLDVLHAKGAQTLKGPSKTQLIEILKKNGQAPSVVENSDGSSTLVLPHGGRILGLYLPGSEENLLWMNPRLGDAKTAAEYFASDDWHNSGGDRTWLAPEVDFFFPNFPDTSKYFQQRSLDPGGFRVVESDRQHVTLQDELTMKAYRRGQECSLRLSKAVSGASNPLRKKAGGLGKGVNYAGYTLRTTLEILKAPKDAGYVGLWNLLQMPNGGEMIVPTYARTEPTIFFGDVPESDLVVEDRAVRYLMNKPGEYKICVPAVACTGRAGYFYKLGDEAVLIVRNFDVDPSGEYVDVWSTDLDDNGYVFQACSIHNESLGQFSELEYHVPAIGGNTGRSRSEDVSSVWAFRGNPVQVASISKFLLGLG